MRTGATARENRVWWTCLVSFEGTQSQIHPFVRPIGAASLGKRQTRLAGLGRPTAKKPSLVKRIFLMTLYLDGRGPQIGRGLGEHQDHVTSF